MTRSKPEFAIPAPVLEKLLSVRGRTLKVHAVTAVIGAVGVLLAAMATAMLIDLLATLHDSAWRAVLTYSAFAAAGLTLGAWLVVAWRSTRRLDRAATTVDREIPQLEQRWSTIAQLSAAPGRTQEEVHPAMFRQVAREASSWNPHVEPAEVVPLDGLLRASWLLVAITVVLAVAVVFDAHRTTVLLKRFWLPYASISATELTPTPGNTVVGRGEPLEIAARIEGTPVKKAVLQLQPAIGDPRTMVLVPRRDDSQLRVVHRLRSVDAPLKYRLRAGDGQTPWYEVVVADRPRLAEVRLTVTPPAYTRQAPTQLERLPRRLSALAGSRLELALRPKQKVRSVQLRLGAELCAQLTADADGWYRWQTRLEKSFSLSPLLTEEHGLTNRRPPKCQVHCLADKPPVVNVLSPSDEIAVQADDTIAIQFTAQDDVGIGSAELIVYGESAVPGGEPVPLATIPVPLADPQGATQVQATVDLDLAQFDVEDGAQLSYAIRVREDRGGGKPPESASPADEVPQPTGPAESTAAAAPSTSESPSAPQADSAGLPLAASDARDASQTTTPAAGTAPRQTEEKSAPPTTETTSPSSAAENPPTETASPDEPSPNSLPEKKTASATTASRLPAANAKKSQSKAAATAANRSTTSLRQSLQRSSSSNAQPSAEKKNPPQSQSAGPALRLLDVPQSSTSRCMRLKIDEQAGAFSGQQRQKLEIEISPRLEELDQALAKAQRLARSVLDDADADIAWKNKHDRDVGRAEGQIAAAMKLLQALKRRTAGTPYAFVGLQLVDIGLAHVEPARREFWKALQTDGPQRVAAVRNGWQHTGRARELLAKLVNRYERSRREYALAESVGRIKKLYRVFIENSLALLGQDARGDRYARKPVEFDLDEEYLARLEEVLKMRNTLRAELARLLGEDPRLLRRFMDSLRNRSENLRNALDDLTWQQEQLNREVKAWAMVQADSRQQLAATLLLYRVQEIDGIATAAAELQDRFHTWLPLRREIQDDDLAATADVVQQIATLTGELSADAHQYVAQQEQTPTAEKKEAEQADSETTGEEPQAEPGAEVDNLLTNATALYRRFTQLEVLLQAIGSRTQRPDLAGFAANRLLETRRLVAQTSAWIRQVQQQQAGHYPRAAEVRQHRLAIQTDALAGKLADIELQLANLMQRDDRKLPAPIANQARKLLATLDQQAAPHQMAAVYALRRNQMPQATARQKSALEALQLAGQQYDQMIQLAIAELDKLPVVDPIAGLLDDPTLDELLRSLEQELPIEELLGIPRRKSNLQIVDDWLRPGGDNAITTGSGGEFLLMAQLSDQQRRMQRQLETAYQQALARALKEADRKNLVARPTIASRDSSDWNRLLSQLGDDLQQGRGKAPPEHYRRAIEQYFRQISRLKDKPPSP